MLEGKRDKLLEQLEEAKRLKENIDRRSRQVANLLSKYLSQDEFDDYTHFVTMKAKLVVDQRELEDKIKLGEEQLAALKEALHVRPKVHWFGRPRVDCVLSYFFFTMSDAWPCQWTTIDAAAADI